jgi:hypothetical protein
MTPIDGKGPEEHPVDGKGPEEDPDDFVDPKGYWADQERNIRRTSGDHESVFKATGVCTKVEWRFLLESLGIEGGEN